MATSPTAIATLPDAPNPNNRATFNALAYPWSNALVPWTVQVNNVAINVYSNAAEAYASAVAAEAQAQAAIAAVNSPKWVTGTNYAAGVTAWSPLNGRTYRTKVALNPSTVDPASGGWSGLTSRRCRIGHSPRWPLAARPLAALLPSAHRGGRSRFAVGRSGCGGNCGGVLDLSLSYAVYLDPGAADTRATRQVLWIRQTRGTIVWTGPAIRLGIRKHHEQFPQLFGGSSDAPFPRITSPRRPDRLRHLSPGNIGDFVRRWGRRNLWARRLRRRHGARITSRYRPVRCFLLR